MRRLIPNIKDIYNANNYALHTSLIFVVAWVVVGNLNSIMYLNNIPIYNESNVYYYTLTYMIPIILVITGFIKEFALIVSKYKYFVLFNIILLSSFIIPPTRNADAMRVWLAKPMDAILNSEKIIRPYAHYNTPDAFTFYHLPMLTFSDGQYFQLSIFACFLSIITILIKLCSIYRLEKLKLYCICLFVFNPFITLSSTVILSDMPVILAISGVIISIVLLNKSKDNKYMIFALAFFMFGINIKYNMLIFAPALLLCVYLYTKPLFVNKFDPKQAFAFTFILINSLYPYFLNLYEIGNPVWPALTNYFPAYDSNFDIAANDLTGRYLQDERSINNLLISLFDIVTAPHHLNPLVILLIIFISKRFRYIGFMPAIFTFSYIFVLWIMMPRFGENEKDRYILYIYPFLVFYGLIAFILYIKNLRKSYINKIAGLLFVSTIFIYTLFNIYYSIDALKYLVSFDKSKWHKHTHYYNDYAWINKNITLGNTDQILVYTGHQLSYYLKKRHINIDPISGYFKDREIFESTSLFDSKLKEREIRYIFYNNELVSRNFKEMIAALLAENKIKILRTNNTFISTSRIFNRGAIHQTRLYLVIN